MKKSVKLRPGFDVQFVHMRRIKQIFKFQNEHSQLVLSIIRDVEKLQCCEIVLYSVLKLMAWFLGD